MTYEEKLSLAKLAYSDICESIDKWEGDPTAYIKVVWSRVIIVDGEIFYMTDLLGQ